MPVKANIDTKFLSRLGLTGLAILALALWFLYDGIIAYPKERERALAYQKLETEARLDQWENTAAEHGWSTEKPEKFEHLFDLKEPKKLEEAQEELKKAHNTDIAIQRWLAGIVAVPALLFLYRYFRARGRWIEAHETGLRTSWGQQLEFGQIVSLDKKKWKSKGIARIDYRQNGRKRRLVLDDWKFDADPTKAILLEVESRIDVGQIVGGAPEPLPEDEHG